MTVVDLRSKQTRITVGGTTLTNQLDELIGSDDYTTETGLVAFRGTLKLTEIWGGESLDDWLGISWLRLGSEITVDVDLGSGWQRHPRGTLFIQGTSYKPGENTLEVACRLGARKFAEPIDELVVAGSSLTDIELSGGSARVIINSLFSLAGCGTPTWHTSRDFTICNRYPLSSSYLDTAGKMLASLECYAWCDGYGVIHIWEVEPDASNLFELGWQELSSWERVLVGQPPATIAHVTGGFRYCHDRTNPIVTDCTQRGDIAAIVPNAGGYGAVSENTLTETIDPAESRVSTTRIEQRLGYQIYKGRAGMPRTQLVASTTETTLKQYSKGADATLQQITSTSMAPLYCALQSYCDWAISQGKPLSLSSPVQAKQEITVFNYDAKWRLVEQIKSTYEPLGTVIAALSGVDWAIVFATYGQPTTPILSERETTQWQEIIPGEWRKIAFREYSQVRDSAAQAGLQERLAEAANNTKILNIYRDAMACTASQVDQQSSNAGQQSPPAAERFSAAEKTEPQAITALVRFQGAASGWAPRTQAYTCPYFPDYASGSSPPLDWAYQYGRQWHQMAIRRWQSVKIEMPLIAALLNYRPYKAIQITTNNAIYRLALNGTSWALSPDRCLVSSDCSLLGRVVGGNVLPLFAPIPQLHFQIGFQFDLQLVDYEPPSVDLQWALGFSFPFVATKDLAFRMGMQFPFRAKDDLAFNLGMQFKLADSSGHSFSGANQPLQGFTGTQLLGTFADDAFRQIPDIGFDFPLYDGVYRSNIYISSNRALTFGYSSAQYSGFSADSPGRALLFGAGDRSWQELWGEAGSGKYRILWYGYDGSSQGSSAARQIEITLFDDGAIMIVASYSLTDLRLLTKAGGSGVSTSFGAYSANTSFVLIPDSPGSDTYSVQQGSYT